MSELLHQYLLNDAEGRVLFRLDTYPLDTDWPLTPHTHPELEISAVKSGSGTYFSEGRCYDIRQGDVFLFNNREIHYISMAPGEKMINVVIHFAPSFLWNATGNDGDYDFLLPFFRRNAAFENRLDRNNPSTEGIFHRLLALETLTGAPDAMTHLEVKIEMERLLLDILRHHPIVANDAKEAVVYNARGMEEVYRYIDENLEGDIRLAQLAGVACMSPSYFSTYFKRCNGLPPVEFIARRRVQKAIQLIRTTNDSLTAIYLSCGFNNSTSFLKTFKRITGNTPSFYRKK